jgi:hypothetical protein
LVPKQEDSHILGYIGLKHGNTPINGPAKGGGLNGLWKEGLIRKVTEPGPRLKFWNKR